MARKLETFMVEGAQIIFRNFAGKEGMYNKEGDRNFCVVLDMETAEQMAADGWNVKFPKDRPDAEEGEETRDPYINVTVGYKGRPPQIVMITSKARTNIGEDMIETLDWVDIANVDLICNAYHWNVNGASGIKAYLKSMYVTIEEDALALKYAVDPDE